MRRNEILLKEVWFAEQTCAEFSKRNKALKINRQVKISVSEIELSEAQRIQLYQSSKANEIFNEMKQKSFEKRLLMKWNFPVIALEKRDEVLTTVASELKGIRHCSKYIKKNDKEVEKGLKLASKVDARFSGHARYYFGTISLVRSNGTCDIDDENNKELLINLGVMDMPETMNEKVSKESSEKLWKVLSDEQVCCYFKKRRSVEVQISRSYF